MLRRATLEDADALSALASTCFTQTFGTSMHPTTLIILFTRPTPPRSFAQSLRIRSARPGCFSRSFPWTPRALPPPRMWTRARKAN